MLGFFFLRLLLAELLNNLLCVLLHITKYKIVELKQFNLVSIDSLLDLKCYQGVRKTG